MHCTLEWARLAYPTPDCLCAIGILDLSSLSLKIAKSLRAQYHHDERLRNWGNDVAQEGGQAA